MLQHTYNAIGSMSGTSLDGLDLVSVRFTQKNKKWAFDIEASDCIAYKPEMRLQLANAHRLEKSELFDFNKKYGTWLGEQVNSFVANKNIKNIDLIGSHGHTVHHQPEKRSTTQIGNGPQLRDITGIPVVCDFRLQDVLLGGQGAPLVPIGDELLFGSHGACLNLGGFANISMSVNQKRTAWDICPVNIVLNKLCQQLNLDYDHGGKIARKGALIPDLLEQLNALPFYQLNPPKSLGREWVEEFIYPILKDQKTEDLLRTWVEHVAIQIGSSLQRVNKSKVLVSGGGAFNAFLIERIQEHSDVQIIIPDAEIINFKEALIFAFLGVLRLLNQPNCLAHVTGAIENHSSGRIYM